MAKFKLLHDYHFSYSGKKKQPIPAGTIFIKSQQDMGYEDLTPYWCYIYHFRNQEGNMVFGEFPLRDVENNSSFGLIEKI